MKKIKNNLSILCKYSVIDKDTNNLSIFNIIEEINVKPSGIFKQKIKGKEEEIIPFPFEFLTIWERTDNTSKELSSKVKTSITCPNGKEKEYIEFPFNFEVDKKRIRLKIQTGGFPFTGYGTYLFNVFIEENKKFNLVNQIPIEIKESIIK